MGQGLSPEAIIFGLVTASDPRVSPDGERILFTRSQADRGGAFTQSHIWLCDIVGKNQRRLTRSGKRNHSPRWSPDGSTIAFVSDRTSQNAIFLLPATGGEARELTRHAAAIGSLAWSPDGKSLAYTAAFDPANPDEKPRRPDSPAPVRVVRRVDYKQDNRGFLNDVRQQVWLVDVITGKRRMLTSEPVDHEYPQWSPDGSRIAVKIPNRNGMHSQIGLVDVATGEVTLIGPRDGIAGCWAWSPDGSRLLIAGDTEQSWQFDVFLYMVDSKATKRLTADLACQPDPGVPTMTPPSQPVWIDDRRAVLHALHGGSSGLYEIDVEEDIVEQVHDWHGQNAFLNADPSGRFFVQSGSSLDSAGHLVRFDRETRGAHRIVEPNRRLLARTPAACAERIEIERGEFTIQAWLLFPPEFDPRRRYPIVLDVHGGPNSWYGPGFNPTQQALAGAGFLTLFSNPRGSGSYGRRFTQQVIRDWGGEDFLDLMAVLDTALERPYAEATRCGVIGYSYGGFMASWIIGHTDRFRAAVIGAPVVDLVSFYGTADIGHDFGPMQIGSKPHDDPEEYRRRSPITYLHKAKTPTLILHGEADDRVPISQGEQLFTTLKENGCEAEFLRYPGGSHVSVTRTGPPAHRLDYLERITDWFARHLCVETG
jgi:dipeptidyl aminopeptidase/acylaminoacyl peptidase